MKRRIHRTIINVFTFIVFFINVFALCAIDSESFIPLIVYCVSGAWLALYMLAGEGAKR